MRARFTGAVFGGHPWNPCPRSPFRPESKGQDDLSLPGVWPAWYYLPAMAKRCEVCGKGPKAGNNVSHAMNKTKRRWLPNLQSVRIDDRGVHRTAKVCTSCLRSKRVTRRA